MSIVEVEKLAYGMDSPLHEIGSGAQVTHIAHAIDPQQEPIAEMIASRRGRISLTGSR
jgi:hypothetical protein